MDTWNIPELLPPPLLYSLCYRYKSPKSTTTTSGCNKVKIKPLKTNKAAEQNRAMQSRIATSLIQRRQLIRAFPSTRSFSGGRGQAPIDEATCAGVDGSPAGGCGRRGRGEEVESDREYFSHHKASPLSEIEVADTRKPIAKATDKTGDWGGDVVVWLPEQLETAEQTMMKAAELWQWYKMRGDPDAPQSRVLRALRGEEGQL